jgi:hypothetical protein
VTLTLEPQRRSKGGVVAQAEGPTGTAVGLAVKDILPSHLLDGGEVVVFAIKPSAWFVLLVSLRWMAVAIVLASLAGTEVVAPAYSAYVLNVAILVAGARLGWATIEWVSRLYVLTNRRVMSIRGVSKVEMFACHLDRIQNTYLTLSVTERLARVGTVIFQTDVDQGETGSWQCVARPLEVEEKLREAIRRMSHRGGSCV